MSSKSAVITFGFRDHTEYTDAKAGNKKHSAVCKFCPGTNRISDRFGTSSGFTRHLSRLHKTKYEEYIKSGKEPCTSGKQHGIASFLNPVTGSSSEEQAINLYNVKHPRQKAIHQALIKDLIVGCSLPLSIVENGHFRHFLTVIDPRYYPMARSTLVSVKLPELYARGKLKIRDILATQQSVSITTDIWSDRVMRSFLGVTAHVIIPNTKGTMELKSILLSCQRFQGSHTGDRISAAFDNILEEMDIKTKIDFVVTDNASNMKAAFKVKFPISSSDLEEADEVGENIEDETVWLGLEEDDSLQVSTAMENSSKKRLSCFAHTLQLVVGDGLKETKGMSLAIAKACRMSTLLHRSTVFKEKFEHAFGPNRSIPAANTTRWNSTLHQLKAILCLDFQKLVEVCRSDFGEVVFSAREWSQLQEMSEVLIPFGEATELTQGDQVVTISFVLPTVLDLNSHLKKKLDSSRHCRPLVNTLISSLQRRFIGIFQNCMMAQPSSEGVNEAFADKIYMLAAVLDPRFGLQWVDIDVNTDTSQDSLRRIREQLKEKIQDLVITEADAYFPTDYGTRRYVTSAASSEEDDTPMKVPRLLAKYSRHRNKCSSQQEKDTTRRQLVKYLEEVDDVAPDISALQFWQNMERKLPTLHQLAYKVLSVPASSAPVERIFSRGGIIMRPHRARLSSDTLSVLMFLKCNECIL